MLEGIYNSAANMTALQAWQENLTRNLANAPVAGYKRSDFSLQSSDRGATKTPNTFLNAPNQESMPVGDSRVVLDQGAVQRSEKPTDFAILGRGYFQVQTADGQSYYTRNGEFLIGPDNTLVNNRGHVLIGEGGPIVIDPEQGKITVLPDGTVSQNGNILGRIQLFDFPNPDSLIPIPGGFIPAQGTVPQPVENPSILQNAIESSNVSPMLEMINLILVVNAYQASQKYITTTDVLLGQAIQTLGTPPMMA